MSRNVGNKAYCRHIRQFNKNRAQTGVLQDITYTKHVERKRAQEMRTIRKRDEIRCLSRLVTSSYRHRRWVE